MEDQTTTQQPAESSALGVSVRGWVTILIVATVCGMSAFSIAVDEPLRGGFIFCIGFYFGQKVMK